MEQGFKNKEGKGSEETKQGYTVSDPTGIPFPVEDTDGFEACFFILLPSFVGDATKYNDGK